MNLNRLTNWMNIPCWELARFNEEIAKHLKGKLLDIGCGGKQEIFKSKVTEYIGLENKDSLKINRQDKLIKADVYGDALCLPFENESFDSVVALQVLEHLCDPFLATAEAYRVLKKGGVFGVTVPFLNRIHSAPNDYFRFTKFGLREILRKAGFVKIKIKSYGGMWRVIGARLAGYLYSDVLGLGYGESDRKVKKRLYLLPIIAPLIILIVIFSLLMDKIHCVKKDAIHYCAICEK